MSTTATKTTSESKNGSINHPIRGAALAMWQLFDKTGEALSTEKLEALAKKNEWTMALIKFHHNEWKKFAGLVAAKAAPAKAAAAKSAPVAAKKAAPAAKKAKAKKVVAKKAAAKTTTAAA